MKSVKILGVKVDRLVTAEVMVLADEAIAQQQQLHICTVNTEFIMQAQDDEKFRDLLNHQSINVPDGIGVVWAGEYLSHGLKSHWRLARWIEAWIKAFYYGLKIMLPIKHRTLVFTERVTGVDLSYQFANLAAKQGYKLFLLGEKEGVAATVATTLSAKIPGLHIAGTFSGDGSERGDSETRQQIMACPADIVLVAYGAPKQEYWIQRNAAHVPGIVFMGVGGTFLYLSGNSRRAPKILQQLALEWLFRLITEPWRWRRQLVLPQFVMQVVGQQIRSKQAT